jgi:uncharacterized protein YbaP (TraB family)
MLFRPLFLLVALLLAAPALAVPALWTVSKGGASLTLYGTIHALPPGGDWFSPRARAAFTKADTLVVEMVPPVEAGAMAATAQALGSLPAPVPIEQRLPPELLPKYRTLAAKGIPTRMLDGMKSWFAALNLVQLEMLLAGIDPAAGVDVTLIRDARAAKKTLRGLETPMGQLELFNGLPEAEQRLLLAAAISEAGESATAMRALVAAWSAGDIARIRSDFDDSSLSPMLERRLFRDRNAAWAHYVGRHLQGKGRIFMAVGAAHMAGPDSLIEMLKARGFKVRRVE